MAKALKRARYEKPYLFQQKGNEEPAVFNSKVEEAIGKAKEQYVEVGPWCPRRSRG